MIFSLRRTPRNLICVLASVLASQTSLLAAAAPKGRGVESGTNASATASAAAKLADEVARIDVADLARAKKEKQISEAVSDALLRATESERDSQQALRIAVEITAEAARSAPSFVDVIARAASFSAPVYKLAGAGPKIRAAAFAAATNQSRLSRGGSSGSSERISPAAGSDPIGRSTKISRAKSLDPFTGDALPPSSGQAKPSFERNSSFTVSAAVGVTHDNNIFLRSGDALPLGKDGRPVNEKISETTTSLTPAVAFNFGQRSMAHGSAAYEMAFTRYAHGAADNSHLGKGSGDFGYNDGRISIDAAATHQQTNEASVDVNLGNVLIRRSVVTGNLNGETPLTAKISVQAGLAVDWTKYKQPASTVSPNIVAAPPALIGSKNTALPIKLFFNATPKLAVSAGFTYSQAKPDKGAQSGQDRFYNVGLRGDLTEKLSTNFSVGYRTRSVAASPSQTLWGFDGAFNYQATPKTAVSLIASRNFSISTLGYSVKATSYVLNFSANPTLHWQFSGAIGRTGTDYGPQAFAATPTANTSQGRSDSSWETRLSATYLFASWLSTSAGWTYRKNNSNIATSAYADTLLNWILVFQY